MNKPVPTTQRTITAANRRPTSPAKKTMSAYQTNTKGSAKLPRSLSTSTANVQKP